MAGKRQAIVLIPGLRRLQRNVQRAVLVENLLVDEHVPLRRSGTDETAEIKIPGASGVRLRVVEARAGEAAPPAGLESCDVFEAYWVDLLPAEAETKPFVRMMRGFGLLSYWFISRIWLAVLWATSWQVALGLLLGGIALIVWYASVVITAANWVLDPATGGAMATTLLGMFPRTTSGLRWLAGWWGWPMIALLLPVTPLMVLVEHAQAVRVLLTNALDERGVGQRSRIRKAVGDVLSAVAGASDEQGLPSYDVITVVAHSFGAVILIDLLADWPHDRDFARMEVVTLGSPDSVLAVRSRWLREETARVLAQKPVARWTDVSAGNDYLSAPVAGHAAAYGSQASRQLVLDQGGLFQTRAHGAYFTSSEVLELLLARPAQAPAPHTPPE
ncbi:hypothetical protein GCM10007301_02450 [Azorhizobium oxalatiphilum]|uniref:Uncharacterized protein n=1 Tax=Azorhizobium oxalatiphilum TaxID=980631 RepID=A0A917BHY2_9HYPH|nr:hypothetical protein [Azorhizobium oxalatiphilum]GGF46449.1 hypothetical protein GCM10007301_02450 [Azorhizobium oxalatiphilum]